MSFKCYRIIFILIFMLTSDGTHNGVMASDVGTTKQHSTNEMENAQSDNKEGRALFPRMEYTNEWTPVGRGDPLKDPTFDYMPPMLDRVRYWAEGTSNKNKNDILLLGVPSKKQHSVKKEKYNYGPIKRTYYSMPYQSHFSSPHHQQQQQYQHPQRLMPPPPHRMHITSDPHSMMSTHHYNHHRPPPPQPATWNNNNIHHTEVRQESSIYQKTATRPIVTTTSTRHPSSVPFLPTIPPDVIAEHSSSTPTSAMSFVPSMKSEVAATTTSAMNGLKQHMSTSSSSKETTKPLLHSILQTETASPFSFTMKPSSIYQIEYTSNIFSPEAINSMATSSSAATTALVSSSLTPTKPSSRPMPIKTTTTAKMTISTSERDEQKHYVQPDMHSAWPVYNLIIEGHSKVKNYGLKNDDPLAASMPKIRPVQAKENPVVEQRAYNDENEKSPEFKVKNQQRPSKQQQKSTMESLLSLLDGSFDNFLQEEEEKTGVRKTRSVENVNNQQESVVGVSFQVDERPQVYRRGTVISESLWPFGNADTTRSR